MSESSIYCILIFFTIHRINISDPVFSSTRGSHSVCVHCMHDVFLISGSKKSYDAISDCFGMISELKQQDTRVTYKKDSIFQRWAEKRKKRKKTTSGVTLENYANNNTKQHKATRHNTRHYKYKTRQHKYNTTKQETTRVQHEVKRVKHETTRNNTSKKQQTLYFDLFISSLHTRKLKNRFF